MKLSKISTFAAIAVSALALNGHIALAQGGDDAPPAPPAPPAAAPSDDQKPPQAPPPDAPQPPKDGGGNNNGGGGRQGGGRGGNRNFADFQQRMNERIKEQMKATDEEWSVIQPLLQNVQTKLMAVRFGGMGGGRRGGPGGPGGGPGGPGGGPGGDQGNRPARAGAAESDALRTALDQDSSTEDIKTKLAALRDARKKAQADLEQAQEELKKVLTVKQEATLVMFSILD